MILQSRSYINLVVLINPDGLLGVVLLSEAEHLLEHLLFSGFLVDALDPVCVSAALLVLMLEVRVLDHQGLDHLFLIKIEV